MKRIKILYVEDDLVTAEYLLEFLQDFGFEVMHTDTITSALSELTQHAFDLILLDLRLPDFDGFELLKNHKSSEIPIIVISAISDTATKVRAFRYGVCDYMVKPIDMLELEARIWSHLQRYHRDKPAEQPLFEIRDAELYMHDRPVHLTPVEFAIFEILLRNANRTVSREDLMDALSTLSSHRTLDYHIRNIRAKIEKESKNPRYLKTEYGAGYKLLL